SMATDQPYNPRETHEQDRQPIQYEHQVDDVLGEAEAEDGERTGEHDEGGNHDPLDADVEGADAGGEHEAQEGKHDRAGGDHHQHPRPPRTKAGEEAPEA